MPLIIENKTKCGLCQKIIRSNDTVVAFQSFTYNEFDELRIFSGGAFHEECFLKHPLKEEVIDRYSKIESESENRICHISKEKIDLLSGLHPDNHIYLGFLTNDLENPLYKYNYVHFNKRYFEFWEQKENFLKLLEEQAKKPGWKSLYNLIDILVSPPLDSVKPEILDRVKKYLNKKDDSS